MEKRAAADVGVEAVQVDMALAENEALNGVPQFYDLPDELREMVEQATLTAERMFWLRATHIKRDVATTALLRRAIYAEQRCWEMENRAAEISLIASGMKEEIERQKKQITTLAGHVDG